MVASADAAMVTELYQLDGPTLFDFARHLGLTDEQAADVVHEGFLRLWRELRRGTVIDQPLAWTYRTTYRLAMEHHRWRRRLARMLPRLAPDPTQYVAADPDRLAVWAAVDRLPARQRHVVYLHYAADLPFEQIAAIIGISPSAARTHASRGRASLRQWLSSEEAG